MEKYEKHVNLNENIAYNIVVMYNKDRKDR
jgi:hypothetical protein